MAVALSRKDAILSCGLLIVFQRMFQSPKEVVSMSTSIKSVTQRFSKARAFYRHSRRPDRLYLLPWPTPPLFLSPFFPFHFPSPFQSLISPKSADDANLCVQIGGRFFYCDNQRRPHYSDGHGFWSWESLNKRAVEMYGRLKLLRRSKEKLGIRILVARKFIIVQSKKLL